MFLGMELHSRTHASRGLVVTGAIAGGVTLNPVILGTILGACFLIKTLAKLKVIRRNLKCVNLPTQRMKKC